MEIFNFSGAETKRINQALGFISAKEVDLDALLDRTLVVKTENYADECEKLAPYYAQLGLEDATARLVFDSSREGMHKILVNKAAISGLSYIHSLVNQLVHLGNLSHYNREHGNIYRMEAEQAIADYYYEFLLWTRFQAMKIATRAHALVSWHEINGDTPPKDGRYRFSQVGFPVEPVGESLYQLVQAEDIGAWREGFWNLLEELATYLGRLAFYQQTANPAEIDDHFPEEAIEETIGLENCLMFYAALQATREYTSWKDMRANMRRAIVGMQDRGKERFDRQNSR